MSLSDEVAAIELIDLKEASREISFAVLTIRNEQSVRQNMYTNHEISLKEHENWLRSLSQSSNSRFFAVMRNGVVIGGVGLSGINTAHSRADWAYYISSSVRGRGIGSALEFKFLDYVFSQEKLNKLNCEVIAWNASVVKLHKKFGFVEEGTRRAHVSRDGETSDVILLGITADEWKQTRGKLTEGAFSGI